MSDTELAADKGKMVAWTEEAKNQLLLQIITQFQDGRSIKWDQINMPGRTIKALQNQWTKFKKSITDETALGSAPATPVKSTPRKLTPRKPRAKKADTPVQECDDSDGPQPLSAKSNSKKRVKGGKETGTAAKKLKLELDDDEFTDKFVKEEILDCYDEEN